MFNRHPTQVLNVQRLLAGVTGDPRNKITVEKKDVLLHFNHCWCFFFSVLGNNLNATLVIDLYIKSCCWDLCFNLDGLQ